jgi:cyclophilin family peptidyl-prolyl cis-trans isomerase
VKTERVVSFVGLTIILFAVGCGGDAPTASVSNDSKGDSKSDSGKTKGAKLGGSKSKSRSSKDGTIVAVETNLGTFEITLDPEKAPLAVDNFLYNYVQRGGYDNTIIHYATSDFFIAGGHTKKLNEIPARAPVRNESDNGLNNLKATVAMSHTQDYPHSATSHFFINVKDNDFFDYDESADEDKKWGYTVFGKVTDGWDVVEKIARVKTHDADEFVSTPVKPIIIKSIRQY